MNTLNISYNFENTCATVWIIHDVTAGSHHHDVYTLLLCHARLLNNEIPSVCLRASPLYLSVFVLMNTEDYLTMTSAQEWML